MQTWICLETSVLRFLFWDFCTILSALPAAMYSVPETRCSVCSTYRKHMGKKYWGHALNYHPTGLTPPCPRSHKCKGGLSSPRMTKGASPSPLKYSPRGVYDPSVCHSPKKSSPRGSVSPSRSSPTWSCWAMRHPRMCFIQVPPPYHVFCCARVVLDHRGFPVNILFWFCLFSQLLKLWFLEFFLFF